MKNAISVSIGPCQRSKCTEMEMLGGKVLIERIGADGWMEKAALLYGERDGKVDGFGAGEKGCGGNGWMLW